MNPQRIPLSDRLIHEWFCAAMDTLNANLSQLNEYDRNLFQKLKDGYNMVGQDLTITRKQLNHIKGVAIELEGNKYVG